MEKLYVKDKNFYKKVAGISIPIALQGLITSGVNMMDTIMIGSVGETEESAKQKGIDAKCVSIPMTFSGRYIAENTDLNGVCKIVINKKTNTLIGAHILGSYAGEFIVAVSAMIDLEVDIENIKKLVFPHPTVCEIVREAIFQI